MNKLSPNQKKIIISLLLLMAILGSSFYNFVRKQNPIYKINWIEVPKGEMNYKFWVKLGGSIERINQDIQINKSYKLSQYPVSTALWHECYADVGCLKEVHEDYYSETMPMTGISWINAYNFTQWLSQKLNKKVRLPTEDEWIYAAHMGQDYASKLSYSNKVAKKNRGDGGEVSVTFYWGKLLENDWGLGVMPHDKIWEWTLSCYGNNLADYKKQPSTQLLSQMDYCPIRVLQGTDRAHAPNFASNGNDAICVSGDAVNDIGFRILLEE